MTRQGARLHRAALLIVSSIFASMIACHPVPSPIEPAPPGTVESIAPAPEASDVPSAGAAMAAEPDAPEKSGSTVMRPVSGQGAAEHGLDAFYDALRRAERHRHDGRALVLQLGDSHTAGDAFTSHLRHKLWQRFGDAGRGYLLPGKPKHHYYQRDAAYGSTGPWQNERGLHRDESEPFGMAGLRVHSQLATAAGWVGTCTSCSWGDRVSRFELSYHPRTDGGHLAYRVDEEAWRELDTRGAEGDRTAWTEVSVPDGPHRLSFHPTGDGPVDLFGVALERDRPGALVDSVGVVGARALHLWRWDFHYVGEQLARRDPRLVILQYGTNETDEPDLNLRHFEDQLVELVARVKSAAPGASVLILGPPDRSMRARRDCDPPRRKKRTRRRPGARGDRRSGSAVASAPGKSPPGPAAPGCEWKTPQILLDVIAAERRAAERAGVPFFDLFAAMGGADLFDGWVHASPALGYGDHVHLTTAGYNWAAELFLSMLLDGYDRFLRTAPPLPPETAALPATLAGAPPHR